MEYEIKIEELPKIIQRIGSENWDKVEIYGVLEDGSKEKIDIYEFIYEQGIDLLNDYIK